MLGRLKLPGISVLIVIFGPSSLNLVTGLARCLTGNTSGGVLQQLSTILYGKASSLRVDWKDDLCDADLFNEWGVFLTSPLAFPPTKLSVLSDSAHCQRRHLCSRGAVDLRKGF